MVGEALIPIFIIAIAIGILGTLWWWKRKTKKQYKKAKSEKLRLDLREKQDEIKRAKLEQKREEERLAKELEESKGEIKKD